MTARTRDQVPDYRDHIARVVDLAPPLGPDQRDRLAALLRPAAETVLAGATPTRTGTGAAA